MAAGTALAIRQLVPARDRPADGNLASAWACGRVAAVSRMPCPVSLSRTGTPYRRTQETYRVIEVAVNKPACRRQRSIWATPVARAIGGSGTSALTPPSPSVTKLAVAGQLLVAARADSDGRQHGHAPSVDSTFESGNFTSATPVA